MQKHHAAHQFLQAPIGGGGGLQFDLITRYHSGRKTIGATLQSDKPKEGVLCGVGIGYE